MNDDRVARASEVRVAPHAGLTAPSADEVLSLSASLDLSMMSVWAALPEVAMRLVAPGEVVAGRSSAMPGRLRNAGRALLRGRGPHLTRVGPVLFLSTSVQTDRVLRPVIEDLAHATAPMLPFSFPALGPVQAISAQLSARRAHRELRQWLAASDLPEPVGLEEELAKAEILIRQGRAGPVSRSGIKVLVVASQHNSPTRALLAAAGTDAEGPLTVYIPHAPVADNPFYRDLPVHYALLRGSAEVAYYERCGVADQDRVRVVGQPGLLESVARPVPDAEHVVYAATTYSDEVLRADIEVISRSVDRPVEVCPHPRMTLQRCKEIFPGSWIVHPPGQTMTVLRARGAFVLIQHGSGVGLEAMGSGVDVIDLCPTGERPNYPYLAEPHVQVVSDDIELRCAIEAVPGRRAGRQDRVHFARTWCAEFDPKASAAAAATIGALIDSPRPERVLFDGWATRGI